MVWPNFLGIGAQRCGTTWLDSALRRHPQVYLPSRRKEIHYFDQFYDRGPAWYESFFPPEAAGVARKAVGEITPHYLFEPLAASRIASDFPGMRLIALLRNPVDRAYSQYGLQVMRGGGAPEGFAAFLERNPEVFARGLYCGQIERYFGRFPREQILILLFEEVMAGKQQALAAISSFLELDATFSAADMLETPVAESRRPRFPGARALATRAGRKLRSWDVDWAVNAARAVGIERIFGDLGRVPPMADQDRQRLQGMYESDIARLEALLGRDLELWRAHRWSA